MYFKKIAIFLTLFSAPLIVLSQTGESTGFTIKGKIDGLKCVSAEVKGGHYSADYIYLYGPVSQDKQVVDSAKVTNGEFIFKGKTDEPIRTVIFFKTEDMSGPGIIEFFIENSNIEISGKYESGSNNPLADIKVTGSKTESEYNNLITSANSERNKYISEYKLAEEKADTAAMSVLKNKIKEAEKSIGSYFSNYYNSHPDSYIRLYSLSRFIQPSESSLNSVEKQLKEMSPKMQNSYTAKNINRQIVELRKKLALGPGSKSMDFTLNDATGKRVNLSDYKGKYVLLDFWASWCMPCRRENPNVLKAYNKFHEKGLEILAVSIDTDREAWLKAVSDDKLPWQQVMDVRDPKSSASVKYYVNAIPENFLIGPDGVIIAKSLRREQLEQKLSEIFK